MGLSPVTIVGIASITLGFFCVLGAYYAFKSRLSVVLGLAALVFLTVIPVICAVFFAATSGM
ncbi:MAG: hypothetical protein SOW59_08925 [Corynebacterium sp.]|nr:hypothetical protein [Corynebacterium sp.]